LPFTLLAPIDAVTASVEPFSATVAAPAEISMPSYGASSIGAVGFADDLATGGTEKALPIASITKVITSLVVLDRHPILQNDPGPEITFDAADVAIYRSFLANNGKVSPVSVGLTLTQREVVELVLIESANNYAASLSAWAFGSETQPSPIRLACLPTTSALP
jgi:D-alanyl-D-alanine carboxypeptidase (penicillin-binding protein 5/6)